MTCQIFVRPFGHYSTVAIKITGFTKNSPGGSWCYDDRTVISIAAFKGHFEIVKYCVENDGFWEEETCENAAKGGFLKILVYLIKNGCPYDLNNICIIAAKKGHLNILCYCIENGCNWDIDICNIAIKKEHHEILKYCKEYKMCNAEH